MNENDIAGALARRASEQLTDATLAPARIEHITPSALPPVALLPKDWKAESLAHLVPKPEPYFRSGTVTMFDLPSLIAGVQRHDNEGVAIYAARDERTGGGLVEAVLDDGEPGHAGRRGDRVRFIVEPDLRFAAWLALCSKPVPQRTFMDFIEEHDREFLEPSGAKMRTFVNGLEIKKLVSFKNVEREGSAARDVTLIYATETQEVNEVKFPQQFRISVPVMRNTAPVELEGRIRFEVEGGKLAFMVKLADLPHIMEGAWHNILAELRAALPDTPVFNGTAAGPV